MTLDDAIVVLQPQLQHFACKWTRNADTARDLVNDTIVKALVGRASYTEGTNVLAWLLTIMKYHFLEQSRRIRNKREFYSDNVIDDRQIGGGQEEAVDSKIMMKRIEALPAKQRDMMLARLRGDEYLEIAAAFGCPVGSVKSRVHRARRAIDG